MIGCIFLEMFISIIQFEMVNCQIKFQYHYKVGSSIENKHNEHNHGLGIFGMKLLFSALNGLGTICFTWFCQVFANILAKIFHAMLIINQTFKTYFYWHW